MLADFLPPQIFQAIAALGFFVVLISLLGCWGAYYEVKWILIVYAIILFALLFAQLAAGIVVFVRREQAPMYVEQAWASTPNELRVQVQNMYSCCGLFAFNDSTSGRPCPGVVDSGSPTVGPTAAAAASSAVAQACLPVLIATAESASTTIGAVVISFAACQLVATILVVVLLCKFRALRRKIELAAAIPVDPSTPASV